MVVCYGSSLQTERMREAERERETSIPLDYNFAVSIIFSIILYGRYSQEGIFLEVIFAFCS